MFLAGGGERDPSGAEGRTAESAGLRRRNDLSTSGWSLTGPALRIGRTRRCAPTKTGGINPAPTSNAFFEAGGDEAERALGALRHCSVLPAQPDERLQVLQRVEVAAFRQQPQRQAS